MAAQFPSAKKTFSAVVNGVTKLVAALFNTPNDEIEAIETFVGAMGRAQAYSDSIKGILTNYRRACRCVYKGAADLYVQAGEIAIPDASGNLAYRKNTSDLTVTWADIDTGAEANSTLYYIYAVADASATTFTVKISANATTPTGCTYYKKLGSFYNDASGNILQESFYNYDELPKKIGTLITKAVNTVYYAYTDGIAYITSDGNHAGGTLNGYTDSANPPTVKKVSDGAGYVDFENGLTMTVKRGDYWKITKTDQITSATVTWEAHD